MRNRLAIVSAKRVVGGSPAFRSVERKNPTRAGDVQIGIIVETNAVHFALDIATEIKLNNSFRRH